MRASKHVTFYILLFTFAVLLRLSLIPNPGFEADISFWKSWGLATYDKGIVEGIKVSNNNYPTPFAYILGGMVTVYSRFADPHNFNEFWTNTNLIFLTVSKMLPILADIGIALLILYIGKNAKCLGFPELNVIPSFIHRHSRAGLPAQAGGNPEKWIPDRVGDDNKKIFSLSFYELLSVIYLFSPLSIIDGALWGQVDSLGVFIFLLALLALLKRRPFFAGLIFMLAMMTKLQNMIYGPIFFLFAWQTLGFDGLVKAITGSLMGFLGLNIEFVLTRNMDRVLASLTENFDYFPWMSLNAYNLWWIVAGGRGMAVSDKLSVLGLLNAKTVGLILFSSFYLFAVLRQVFETWVTPARVPADTRSPANQNVPSLWSQIGLLWKKDPYSGKSPGRTRTDQRDTQVAGPVTAIKPFLESLILVNASFFLFQTQSHDRYAFPLSVFLLLWAPFWLDLRSTILDHRKKFLIFSTFYLIFTIFYFYNLHTALVINYPHNGLPFLSSLTQPFFTISTAFILLGLFGVFLFSLARSSRFTVYCLLFTVGLLAGSLIYLNKPLFTHQPVSLTKFTPYISEQAYGTRQTNRTVNSFQGGPNKWTRLSVQYVFYAHGIGTHANSKHVFDINGNFTKFTTDYGIDTEAGTKASAIFEIYGDNKLLFRSPVMGRYTYPGHAEVSMKGMHKLMLITTDAGDSNYDDHTDWLNPRLFP